MRLKPVIRKRDKSGSKFVSMGYTDSLTPAQRMERRNPGYGAERQRAYRKRHPERVHRAYLKRVRSGKIKEYYRKWRPKRRAEIIAPQLSKQQGRCAICKRKLKYPNQDHNHGCCKPKGGGMSGCPMCRRGLLCGSCNGSLSMVENPKLLKTALAYLKAWRKRLSGK